MQSTRQDVPVSYAGTRGAGRHRDRPCRALGPGKRQWGWPLPIGIRRTADCLQGRAASAAPALADSGEWAAWQDFAYSGVGLPLESAGGAGGLGTPLDCRKLKASLRAADFGGGLSDLVHDVVSVRRVPAPDNPEHFFEVELKGIVRHRNDRLLNPQAVADYLAQVAPVPFSPEFRLGSDITAALRPHVALGDLDIRISGIPEPVFRPHRDWLEIADDKFDPFTDVEILEIPGIDGGVGAVVWVLHHSYAGAIPAGSLVKGLRLRSGNIQIGDHMLLEELFAEARFNSWAVGEVHVVERRITPNGRRDHFEQSVHVDNLFNHLAPLARDVASRCRRGSVRRRWLRDFDLHATAAREKIEIIAQGGLGKSDRGALVQAAKRALSTMEKITVMPEVVILQSVHCIPR